MNPSLLLITGWAHGKEAVQPMADALSDRYTVQILTGSEALNAQQVPDSDYIVTGSMGGLLAMELLPESCKKLVLISSTAKFCADEDYPCGTPERILKRMILQLKRNPEAVLDDFFKNVHFPNRERRRGNLTRLKEQSLSLEPTRQDASSTLNDLVDGLEYLVSADFRLQTPNLNLPVLLLHGADDRIIPATAAEWLHDHLPDSQLRIFENDGHALSAHHFGEVMGAIRNFL